MGIPFITLEDVDVVDASCIAMGFDKSLPCTSGRGLDKRDDILFVLQRVPDFPGPSCSPHRSGGRLLPCSEGDAGAVPPL